MTVLWGTKVGSPDWEEQVITESKSDEYLGFARKWAMANGYDRLRELTVSDIPERPDFAGTVAI